MLGLNRPLARVVTEEIGPLLRGRGRRREVLRFLQFGRLSHLSPLAAVDSGGMRFVFDTGDRYIGRTLFMSGSFDLEAMSTAVAAIRDRTGKDPVAGRTLLDVGANIGTTSIQACRLFGAARSFAFEPDPENIRLLKANLALNDLEGSVRVVPAAVSDSGDDAVLQRSADNSGDHRLRPHGAAAGTAPSETVVPCITLDAWIHANGIDPRDIGLVWVDTQGHEAQVLSGAEQIVRQGVPVVIEYWPQGLRQAGGLERLNAFVEEHFDVVIDVQATGRNAKHALLVPSELGRITDELDRRARMDDPGVHRDLILLRG